MNNDLKKWRIKSGLTLSQAASLINVSPGYISLLENGKRKPSIDVIASYEYHSGGDVSYQSFVSVQT